VKVVVSSPLVPPGFETLGNNGINAGRFTFGRQPGIGNHMRHDDAFLFKKSGPFGRTSCGGENDFNPFLHNYLHELVNVGIEQRYIHPPGLGGCFFYFLDVFTQNIGIHTACSQQA
jgi:hypothetical protein